MVATESILADWRSARREQLKKWKLVDIRDYARELGWRGINDASRDFNLTSWVVDEEFKRIVSHRAEQAAKRKRVDPPFEAADDYPPADVTGVPWDELATEAQKQIVVADYSDELRFHIASHLFHSQSAREILANILPGVLEMFLHKNKDYGDSHRESKYGVKGGLIELDRKFGKLYNAIWLEQEMAHEGPVQMLQELIGSALLELDLIERDGT